MSETTTPKIVIVEDEGLIAADLSGRLTSAGYAVSAIADSAVDALRVIRETSPDLVLMDIRLKGNQDGISAAQRVREDFDIPVIYLTAFEDRTTLERASATHAYGYIKKPIASASLRGSIELALAKHRDERSVREQRDWAIASFGAVPYAVLVTDKLSRISYLNAAAEQLCGCTADGALGRQFSDVLRLLYRESGEPTDDFIAAAMNSGDTVTLPPDILLLRDADQGAPVEGSVAPRWRDGHIDGTVIALRDMSLARFNEEQVQLESKHQALRRFSTAVLQQLPDFKMAVWDSTLILDTLSRTSPLRLSAENLDRTAMDAFAVTCRLASFAHVPDVHLDRVVLNELIAGLEPTWKQLLPRVVLSMQPDPVPVQADADELSKAFAGILLYARDHIDRENVLLVEMSHLDWEPMSDWVRIRFEYSSAEETRASLERAFEPSWKEPAAELDMAYGTIRGMGGLLTGHLERGKVTVFEIYLRCMEVGAAAVELPDPDDRAIHVIGGTDHSRFATST